MCQRTHNLFYFILVGGRLFFNTLNGLASLFGSQAEDIHSSGKITRAETASRLRDATYQLSIGPVDLKRFQLLIILDLYFIREDTWLNIYFFACWLQFVTYARFRNYRNRGALIGTIKCRYLEQRGTCCQIFHRIIPLRNRLCRQFSGILIYLITGQLRKSRDQLCFLRIRGDSQFPE